MKRSPLTIAVPKGRVQKALSALFAKAGLDAGALDGDDRRLVRDSADGKMRFLLLKPDDVPTYVEFGAADIGVSGRDVLLERRYDLYQPLDLGIGRCRMVVAAPLDRTAFPDVPRVATKYPRITAEHFAARGRQIEVIFVQGSVELAPLVGLADLIVDVVETGSTLRENHLGVIEEVAKISSVLVANRSAYKLRSSEIAPILDALATAAQATQAAAGT
ncbi:MAG TPA: ATP phosphoribosyltransferase [Polyangiaceae bacterium]|nr:ATP phosphoribosyltransferase [Polyangiaceae bacterium]